MRSPTKVVGESGRERRRIFSEPLKTGTDTGTRRGVVVVA